MKDNANPSVVWITRTWTREHVRAVWGNGLRELMDIRRRSVWFPRFSDVCLRNCGYGFARFIRSNESSLRWSSRRSLCPPDLFDPAVHGVRFFEIPGISWLIGLFKEGADSGICWIRRSPSDPVGIGHGVSFGCVYFYLSPVFRGPPQSFEAAAIDGCGQLRHIFAMLLNAKSAMATVEYFRLSGIGTTIL